MDLNGAKEAEDNATRKQRVADFFGLIPGIGASLKFLFTHWGGLAIVFVIGGFGVGWGLVLVGQAPEFLIAKYRGTLVQPTAPPKVGPKPKRIDIAPIKTPDDLDPYSRLLEAEDLAARNNHLIDDFVVASFEGKVRDVTPGDAIPAFEWVLEADSNFDLSGLGFELIKIGSAEYFRQLKMTKDTPTSVGFEVPQCNADDRLIVILRKSWKGKPEQTSLVSIKSIPR